jgi:hypothetical protein
MESSRITTSFECQLGHLGVLFRRPVEGGVDDLALHRTLHVGDLFGSLVHEDHHQIALGVVGRDGGGDLLEDGGLACLRRRHDQASLTLADRGDEVDDPGEHTVGLALDLETKTLVREQRGEALELRAAHRLFRSHAVHRVDADQRRELLLGAGRTHRASHQVALAQPEPANLCGRHVHVLVTGQVAGATQETVTLGEDVEQTLARL